MKNNERIALHRFLLTFDYCNYDFIITVKVQLFIEKEPKIGQVRVGLAWEGFRIVIYVHFHCRR